MITGIPLVLHSAVTHSHDAMTSHAPDFLPLIFLAKHTQPIKEGMTSLLLHHKGIYCTFRMNDLYQNINILLITSKLKSFICNCFDMQMNEMLFSYRSLLGDYSATVGGVLGGAST